MKDEAVIRRIRQKRLEGFRLIKPLTEKDAAEIVDALAEDDGFYDTFRDEPELLYGMVRLLAEICRVRPPEFFERFGLEKVDVQSLLCSLGMGEDLWLCIWEDCYHDNQHFMDALARLTRWAYRAGWVRQVPEHPDLLKASWLISDDQAQDELDDLEEEKDKIDQLEWSVEREWEDIHMQTFYPEQYRARRDEMCRISMCMIDGLLSRDVQ